MGWDLALLHVLAAHRSPVVTELARGLADVGQSAAAYVVASLLAVAFAGVFSAWRAVAAAMLASVVATAVAELTKELIGRPRPSAALALVPTDGFAMPSSIAALTAGAATPLILWGLRSHRRGSRLVALLLTAGTLLVGASMVYLGAHWLSDVLVGWMLGVAIGTGTYHLLQRFPATRAPRLRPAPGEDGVSRPIVSSDQQENEASRGAVPDLHFASRRRSGARPSGGEPPRSPTHEEAG